MAEGITLNTPYTGDEPAAPTLRFARLDMQRYVIGPDGQVTEVPYVRLLLVADVGGRVKEIEWRGQEALQIMQAMNTRDFRTNSLFRQLLAHAQTTHPELAGAATDLPENP